MLLHELNEANTAFLSPLQSHMSKSIAFHMAVEGA